MNVSMAGAAKDLIDFDREFARMLSAPPKGDTDADDVGVDPEELRRHCIEQGRFTAGVATGYAPSLITGEPTYQYLADGLPVGMRFHSAPVIRPADAKLLHLGHVARAEAAWRLYRFADRAEWTSADSAARRLCDFLATEESPITRFTPDGAEPDSVIDVRAVFQQGHRYLDIAWLPAARDRARPAKFAPWTTVLRRR